ncbi:MAG: di-trans,poly-cis-decaprenylcistransferase [Flavobacteriaceae bacterium]|nr:MAG: di-trans,poly-cis-decaprenylcistransferase [Flavobacteriaceae bacterium]
MTTHTQLIDTKKLPKHIAIIMDGNGRWAKEQGKPRIFGHKHGVSSVREILETSVELGIEYLTLYAFSTENWKRPKLEVTALMNILVSSLKKEVASMHKNNVKLNVIGNMEALPSSVRKKLSEVIALTKNNTGITLSLALSYGSREEIVNAIKKISEKVVNNSIKIEEIDEKVINNHLYTFSLPDVDLLIRTSGEQRISNFLLWQIAYSELYFTNVCWPDFKKPDLIEAITTYQNRERRFGKTSEQIEKT